MFGHEATPRRETIRTETRLVCGLSDYEGKSPRLRGLKELESVGAKTSNPLVITDAVFRHWKDKGGVFSPQVRKALTQVYDEVEGREKGTGVHIGRAFYVPGNDQPRGPRTADIQNADDFINEVGSFYAFITEETDYDQEGAEIALLTHPFMNAVQPPVSENPLRPYTGGAAFMREDGAVEIHAGYGQDEVVQGKHHDVYVVRFEGTARKFSSGMDADIRQKRSGTVVVNGEYDKDFPIDESLHYERALADGEIGNILTTVQRLNREYGPRRVEFMVQPEGVIFRECLPDLRMSEHTKKQYDIKGPALVIRDQSREELADIMKQYSGKDLVIYLHEDLFKGRLDVLPSVGNNARQFNVTMAVLSYGTRGITGHRVKNLTDLGFDVKFIGETDLIDNGEEVRVFTEDGTIQYEKEDPVTELGLVTEDRKKFGGKAIGLARLLEEGFAVPEGFVVETAIFRRHLERAKVTEWRLSRLARLAKKDLRKGKNKDRLEKALQEVHDRIIATPVGGPTLAHLKRMFALVPTTHVSMRSSATCEDERGSSFAGLFESVTNVDKSSGEEVAESLKKIFASVFTPDVFETAKTLGVDTRSIEMAVVCHERVDAKKQGVIHTNESDSLVIEVGHDEEVVEGTAQAAVIAARDPKSNAMETSGELMLTTKEIRDLKTAGLRIERAMDGPQDIEWAITPENKIVFLQTRPTN